MGMKSPIETQIANLASEFSRLEWLCHHPKEAETIEKLLQEMKEFVERLLEKSSPALQELLNDLKLRVATWHEVWARLGKDVDFRNAVGRGAHRWSGELLKFTKVKVKQ